MCKNYPLSVNSIILFREFHFYLIGQMSFSFSKVKDFAVKVKDTVTNNVNSIVQNNLALSHAGSTIKEGFSDVISSVKSTSAAVGKQIADNLATKTSSSVSVSIRGSEVRYVMDNMG